MHRLFRSRSPVGYTRLQNSSSSNSPSTSKNKSKKSGDAPNFYGDLVLLGPPLSSHCDTKKRFEKRAKPNGIRRGAAVEHHGDPRLLAFAAGPVKDDTQYTVSYTADGLTTVVEYDADPKRDMFQVEIFSPNP